MNYLSVLAHASPALLWDVFSHPRTILTRLALPPRISPCAGIAALFPDVESATSEARRLQLLTNERFFSELNAKYVPVRKQRASCNAWQEFLYMAVRFLAPEVAVETGVFDGISSSVILQAMHDNAGGTLVSIDLPARGNAIRQSTDAMAFDQLPPGCGPGWAIPDYLRERHALLAGDSRELLPQVFEQYPTAGMFLHDSLHTYDHMLFEYATAWPHIVPGGLLLSDDITWNSAFHEFTRGQGKKYIRIVSFGAVRK